MSAVLKRVAERARSLTGADGAAIAICDNWGVVCRASTGDAPDVGSRLGPDSVLTKECLESGQVVVCEDAEKDSRVRLSIAKSLHLRSAAAVPIKVGGAVLGVMEVLSSRATAFDTTHVVQLQRIAHLLAPVLAPAPVQSEERVTRMRTWLAVAGLALSLFVLLLFVGREHREPRNSRPTTRAAVPLPAASSSSKAEGEKAGGVGPLELRTVPTEQSKSLASVASPEARAKAAPAQLDSKPPGVEGRENAAVNPASPALVIEGAPPGTQIFVDDQLTASVNSRGQAEISTLAPGQHSLRLALDGYQDYAQGIDLRSGQGSRVVAKLEPSAPPILTESPIPPGLDVTATIPRAPRPMVPEFVLDRTLKGHSSWVTGLAFSADGQRLASGSWDQTVKFWDLPTRQNTSIVASKIKQEVQALAFSRDGRWLAVEDSTNSVTLRDATTGREIRKLSVNKPLGVLGSSWVYSIAFSPDGRWLAAGVDDKTVRVWDIETGRVVRDLTGLRRSVIYIAFSPDGRWLASGRDDKTIKLWEVATGKEIQTLRGHKKNINAVVFSPNGRWLASASADKSIKLWDVITGREVRALTGHENNVTSVAFSPDGRWLASGSWDKTIRIWDRETGREVQTLEGHTNHIYTVAFDSRGHWLASGSEDGTIKLWRLGPS